MMAAMLLFMLRVSRHNSSNHVSLIQCSTGIWARRLSPLTLSNEYSTSTDAAKETSLLWLSASRLRVRDNLALAKAADFGPDGLGICIVWPFGNISTAQKLGRDQITPVKAFGFAALSSLNGSLANLGQKLWLIPSEVIGDVDHDPVSVIADLVKDLKPGHVIVDTCLLDMHRNHAARLRDKVNSEVNTNVIEIKDEDLLIHYKRIPKILGRSRGGGRALRWSTFLNNALTKEDEFESKVTHCIEELPPPLVGLDHAFLPFRQIPKVQSFPSWAKDLLLDWGEVSEEEAIRRANRCTAENSESNPSFQLSERGSKDSKLSPYLRFGMISPQRALRAGARKRDLLWRDWSRVCWHLLNPLRRGEPILEYMDKCNNLQDFDNEYDTDDQLFNMWVVGNTGSPVVDAGMRQLWREGWMPRKVRLLTAACLVEGMGLDWKLGRDWFEHTLIDHDPAINELMWQNAGLVGVDPFYNGIAWEAAPSDEEKEYVSRWTNEKLHWPSHLKPYAESQPLISIVTTAKSRRAALALNGVYKAARTISNSGVRVAWPGIANQSSSIEPGEVLGVGMKPLRCLSDEMK